MTADDLRNTLQPWGLGPAGQAVWDELATDDRSAVDLALIAEASRIADRLERLHSVLTGSDTSWLRIVPARDNSTEYVLRVSGAMQEARQQAVVLKQIRAEITRGRNDIPVDEDDDLANL
ncbi:hypothetical protein [Rhodococcus qingshengii]